MRLSSCFLLFAAFATNITIYAQEKWKKIDVTNDSITIYQRVNSTGTLYEYKAICAVNAPVQAVFESAIADETYRDLKQYVTQNKVYKTKDIQTWYVYQRFSFMLLNDRDYTLRYDTHYDTLLQKYVLNWNIANDIGPEASKNVVRLKICNGSIVIWPHKQQQKSYLQYQICTDPGGIIPSWMVNIINKSTIPEVLRAIASHAKF